MKRTIVLFAVTGMAMLGVVSPAQADPGNGHGYGFGCQILIGDETEFDNPGAMLQELTDRDGSFQITVGNYFDSVADLIDQKCGR